MSDADNRADVDPNPARTALLGRIIGEVAINGLADRSLREIAEAIGSSHRMVLYHFGSRAGLVAAIVEATEARQREDLVALAAEVSTPAELVRALWRQVTSEELRPFVRLFFECVGITGGEGLTEPWLEVSQAAAGRLGVEIDPVEIRLGVAVSRGLLIDVLATGEVDRATRSLERFLELWEAGSA
jgi:AcrR family transcriptional regulator